MIFNAKTGKKVKVPRLVRLHANEMEDVEEIKSGEIGAMFGVECSSGDTFTDGKVNYSMVSEGVHGESPCAPALTEWWSPGLGPCDRRPCLCRSP